jgi:uncharacterized membrane protein YdjX (TVP38/TMEM64 family)
MDRIAKLKIVGAVLLLLLVIFALSNDAIRNNLSKESMQTLVESYGALGPIIFIIISALGVTLFIPASAFNIVAAVVFGLWEGLLYAMISLCISASISFFIARTLGHDLAQRAIGGKIRHYAEKIDNNGFAAILYLRLLYFPLFMLNYGAGLTNVRFRDYFLGTVIGLLPGMFIFIFFFSQVTVSQLSDLLRWQVALAASLFIGSFFIPTIVRKYFRT